VSRRALHVSTLAAFAVLPLTAAEPIAFGAPRHWRIAPIGDSITQGDTNHLTYRFYLWKMLIDAGVDFDFVGSLNTYAIVNPDIPPYRNRAFDYDHEGHVFYQASEIAGQLPHWLAQGQNGGGYTPDIALVHAGTNDALLRQPVATTVASLTSIVTTLQARNPQVKVLLAKILPIFSPLDSAQQANASINAINTHIDAIAAATDRPAGKPEARVIVVDHNTGFVPNHTLPPPQGGDTYDGVHPSSAGEEKMARRWLEALQLFLLTPTIGRDTDGRLTVDFLRVKNSTFLHYRTGVGSTPGDWDWSPAATESVSLTSGGDWTEQVRLRDATAAPARFLRFEITLTPAP
jgi:lysophospholipase L1-like esterase